MSGSIGVGRDHFAASDRVHSVPGCGIDRAFDEPNGTIGKQGVYTTWVTAA